MKCPKDQSELSKRIYESDIEIDECPQCRGVWLDNGELEKIQETKENDYSEELKTIPNYISGAYTMANAKQEEVRKCPNCDNPMISKEYSYCSQINIDLCPHCQGIWLDKNELKNLEIFFERSRIETKEIRLGFFKSLLKLFK